MDSFDDRPHVVMLVANDVCDDGRVTKMAASARLAGYQVTVVGTTRGSSALDEVFDGIRLIRVPVGTELRTAERARSAVPPAAQDPLAVSRYGARVRGIQHRQGQRDLTAQIGRLRRELARDVDLSRLERWWRRRWYGRRIQGLKRRARDRQAEYERWRTEWKRRRETTPAAADEARAPAAVEWRRAAPWLLDLEVALASVLDSLDADLIHAHDFHVIGIAEEGAARAAARGRHVAVVYDAHEFVPGMARPDGTIVDAFSALEAEYIRRVDGVVTVSDPLADMLVEEHGLDRRPTVVLNSPLMDAPVQDTTGVPSLREIIGVRPDTPLLVYSGGATAARGIHTLVDALVELPGWELALVTREPTRFVGQLLARAEDRGVRARCRLAPYVPNHLVSAYLSEATIGVHPLVSGYINHEIALPNKLFEYLHAGLPLVVSDCRAMASFVREAGVGEVFTSGSATELAAAVERVAGDLDGYRSRIDVSRYGWEAQERAIIDCYREVGVPPGPRLERRPDFTPSTTAPPKPARLLHTLAQPDLWEPAFSGHEVEVWAQAPADSPDADRADVTVTDRDRRRRQWQLERIRWLEVERVRFALVRQDAGLLGTLCGDRVEDEVPLLRSLGTRIGVLLSSDDLVERFARHDVTLFSTSPRLSAADDRVRWLPLPLLAAGPTPASDDGTQPVADVRGGAPSRPGRPRLTIVLPDGMDVAPWMPSATELSDRWDVVTRPSLTDDELSSSTLVIDGTAPDGYGQVAPRAMALGVVPVLPEGPWPPELPHLNAAELSSSAVTAELPAACRAFAREHHDGSASQRRIAAWLADPGGTEDAAGRRSPPV